MKPTPKRLIRWLGEQYQITICDQYSATAAEWGNINADGLHPDADAEGYVVMASAWDKALVGADYPLTIETKDSRPVEGERPGP